jgi:hypothetical protein
MRRNQTAKTTIFKTTSVQLPEVVTKAMLKHSRVLNGCPRPIKGSMNHFAVYAILKTLKDYGENFMYLYPEYYQ